MPVMTEPLAHLEMLVEKANVDFYKATEAKKKLESRIEVLMEYREELKDALREERKKLIPPQKDRKA